MSKDKHPAETYAQEVAGKWLYDAQGYCPFARHKLEGLLQRAHEAGAASVKKTNALTPLQREAVVDALTLRIAELNEHDDTGIPTRDARATLRILTRVRNKLTSKGQENENV